jgi:hypothetical protein
MTGARLCLCYGRTARKVEAIDWHRAPDGRHMLCGRCGLGLRGWVIDKILARRRQNVVAETRLRETQHEHGSAHS